MLDGHDREWWRGAVIYQIYPRSFRDSDGNGVGDLAGITAQLDYLASLGVDALWISPFFKSPMEDFGYDVEDYRAVDPLFGSLEDFKTLLTQAHARGLRILIDLVISHTSERHPWFVESRQNRINPRAEWYVWADPLDTGAPPNNWLSMFGGCAWEWDPRRSQYYLHNFLKSQPDLNFHNPQVQEAVLGEARFWLEFGVDGFRLDVVNYYFHDPALRSNPPLPPGTSTHTVRRTNPYAYQDHRYDKTQPETLEFLERFRALLNAYPGAAAVGELGIDADVAETSARYTERDRRLHMVYSFDLMCDAISAGTLRSIITAMEQGLRSGWVSWALSNHDFPRVISRWCFEDQAETAGPLLIALACTLKGSPCIYQGDELGLAEATVPFERIRDPYGKTFWPQFKGRDGCRTPIPWEAQARHAGFSTVDPWLPIPDAHFRCAVDRQHDRPDSPLNRVRQFLAWRKQHAVLLHGSIACLEAPEPVLALLRDLEGRQVLALFNLSGSPVVYPLPEELVSGRAFVPAVGHGFAARVDGHQVRLPALGAAFLLRTRGTVVTLGCPRVFEGAGAA